MAKAGGIFDPKMFKGNIELEKYFNECALSKLPSKKVPVQSLSYKLKKKPGMTRMKKAAPIDKATELEILGET